MTLLKALLLAICAFGSAESVANIYNQTLVVAPGASMLPVTSASCNSTQLVLYIDFVSTTELTMYVYPPDEFGHCTVMTMYYTALGPPAISDATNLTAWYVSDIMSGLTCFGIQNGDGNNVATVTITATMSCDSDSQSSEIVEIAEVTEVTGYDFYIKPGWYFTKPTADLDPKYPNDYSSSASPGPVGDATHATFEKMIVALLMVVWILFWYGV